MTQQKPTRNRPDRLVIRQITMPFENGVGEGLSYRWPEGQYCAIHTDHGVVGCGIFDTKIAGVFSMAFAIARGTPTQPLVEPEDLLEARIVEVSVPAEKLGVVVGMTGREAIEKMLRFELKN
ncbi:MAG: DUF1805 domain-containing protein [Planctomycetaceae bacterium]|nr:DUF1805 domain-containing protein [Planctomycetaceae bacterium]MBN8604481.1 DUF1805 domain-containing protein [Planctomycetota bacterium]